ncbi:hypothetical protein BV898_12577 [Hypsibius exemplaris]|uniref:Uncharacterized protein n=1 Tax=Hypsibius exemplaris TaxID=2072580 RepID=A0A1W0WD50_HYPEX|nr:hypothetical protein BV898_12577 [Hypsibius exemplaris]
MIYHYSILEAVVNFFDVVNDNVANIHELERDFVQCRQRDGENPSQSDQRKSQTASPGDDPETSSSSSFPQQNTCHEPVTRYALVDVRAFDIFSALEHGDPKARNLLSSSTIISNSEAYDLILSRTAEKQATTTTASHFGPYVDPPTAEVFSDADFFVPSLKRPCV